MTLKDQNAEARPFLTARENVIVLLAAGRLPEWVAAELETTKEAVEDVARSFGWPTTLRRLKAAATRILGPDRDDEHQGPMPPSYAPGVGAAAAVGEDEGGTAVHVEIRGGEDIDPDELASRVRAVLAPPTPACACPEGSVVPGALVHHHVPPCPLAAADEPVPELSEEELAAEHARDLAAAAADPVFELLDMCSEESRARLDASFRDRAQLVVPGVVMSGPDGKTVLVARVRIDIQVDRDAAFRIAAGLPGEGDLPVTAYSELELTPDGVDIVGRLAALLPPPDWDGDRS